MMKQQLYAYAVQLNTISPTNSFISRDSDTHQGMLVSSVGSVFKAVDWKSVLILPSQVAFRSEDLDSNYLRSIVLNKGLIYQKFESGLDRADPLVAKELLPTADGNYRIKDLYTGEFWKRRDNDWINGEPDDEPSGSLFSISHIQDNVFCVRDLGNNNYCGAVSEDDTIDCLCAYYPNITKQTLLIVEECVLQREIKDVLFELPSARIYDEQIIELTNRLGHNNTSEPNTLTLTFPISVSSSLTFNNSTSINFGVKGSTEVFLVPVIGSWKGDIKLSADFGSTHEWGATETTETKREASYTITIPPFTRMKVAMMCTKGTLDIPFLYTQRDLLTPGTWVSTDKDDGLFTGIYSYDFYFQSTEINPDEKEEWSF